jgi:hypothetical protein
VACVLVVWRRLALTVFVGRRARDVRRMLVSRRAVVARADARVSGLRNRGGTFSARAAVAAALEARLDLLGGGDQRVVGDVRDASGAVEVDRIDAG